MAKITPQEIDTAEIHDAFSVCEFNGCGRS